MRPALTPPAHPRRAPPGKERLSPLQLAAKLGNKRMFKHILHYRTRVEWTWGPEYELRAGPRDSATALKLCGHVREDATWSSTATASEVFGEDPSPMVNVVVGNSRARIQNMPLPKNKTPSQAKRV